MRRIDELCVNTLRFLAVETVETARSGHPGMPLGAAPLAYVLWDRFLRVTGRNPSWFNRDRFSASAPGTVVYDQLGFTVDAVVDRAIALVR